MMTYDVCLNAAEKLVKNPTDLLLVCHLTKMSTVHGHTIYNGFFLQKSPIAVDREYDITKQNKTK